MSKVKKYRDAMANGCNSWGNSHIEDLLVEIERLEKLFEEIRITKPIVCDGNPQGDYVCDIHQEIAVEALTGKKNDKGER